MTPYVHLYPTAILMTQYGVQLLYTTSILMTIRRTLVVSYSHDSIRRIVVSCIHSYDSIQRTLVSYNYSYDSVLPTVVVSYIHGSIRRKVVSILMTPYDVLLLCGSCSLQHSYDPIQHVVIVTYSPVHVGTHERSNLDPPLLSETPAL